MSGSRLAATCGDWMGRDRQRTGATIVHFPYHSLQDASVPAVYRSSYGLSVRAYARNR